MSMAVSEAPHGAAPRRGGFLGLTLTQWIMVSLILGIVVGALFPDAARDRHGGWAASDLQVLATVFLRMIKSLIVPLLKLFSDISWINTYQAMILPTMSFALPLAVWNLTAFFRQMPFELEYAAMVDGCTRGQAFRKIIVPLAAPGVFTTAILTFIAAWNEFLIALTMVNKKSMQTATVAISKFTGAYGFDQPFGTQMAAGVVVTVPLVIVVLVAQRRIIAGLTAGGVK